MVVSRLAAALQVSMDELAAFQRNQIATDVQLVTELVARGMQPVLADELVTTSSASVRQELLRVLMRDTSTPSG
jgi:hypothetical protein